MKEEALTLTCTGKRQQSLKMILLMRASNKHRPFSDFTFAYPYLSTKP